MSTKKTKRIGEATQLERTITVRVANEDVARLEAVGERLGIKAMTIARMFIRQGLDRIEAEGPAALFGQVAKTKRKR